MIVTTSNGRLRAALGASGGPRIISSVIQTLFRCAAAMQKVLCAPAQVMSIPSPASTLHAAQAKIYCRIHSNPQNMKQDTE